MSLDSDYSATQDTPYEQTQQATNVNSQDGTNALDDEKRIWGRAVSSSHPYKYPTIDLIGTKNISFGRKSHCGLSIKHAAISGEHCSLHRIPNDDVVFLTDHSTNGTYIDGQRIGKGNSVVLSNGQEFVLLRTANEKVSFIFHEVKLSNSNLSSNTVELYSRYDIREQLGSGSFAVVKLCVNKKTGKKFACKIIDKQKFQQYYTTERINALNDEVDILRQMSHPNIIRVYEHFETTESLYLILELIHGGDLFDKIISLKGKGLPEQDSRYVFMQLTDAVYYLHENNVVHRDLKPENVLLATKDSLIVKLSDFGLSRVLGTNSEFMTTQCGTPQYLAPEVLTDSAAGYNKSVDCWSLGVILYILLSGRAPFSQDPAVMQQQIKHGKIDFSVKYWKNVSQHAKDLVKKLMTVAPESRLSVAAIYDHPWVAGKYKRDEVALSMQTDMLRNSVIEQANQDNGNTATTNNNNTTTANVNNLPHDAITPLATKRKQHTNVNGSDGATTVTGSDNDRDDMTTTNKRRKANDRMDIDEQQRTASDASSIQPSVLSFDSPTHQRNGKQSAHSSLYSSGDKQSDAKASNGYANGVRSDNKENEHTSASNST